MRAAVVPTAVAREVGILLPRANGFETMVWKRVWERLGVALHVMYIGIKDLIRNCGKQRVAFAVGTLLSSVAIGVLGVVPGTLAAEEAAIRQLIETGECAGCDLHDADLRRLNLAGVDLTGADLEGANFYYANLDGAQLEEANLIDVNLGYASAQNATLDRADLRYAIFDTTNLTGASMVGTDLRDAYIKDANFTNAVLDRADMRDTLFHDADFSRARLCGVITWAGIEYRRGCEVAVPEEIDD